MSLSSHLQRPKPSTFAKAKALTGIRWNLNSVFPRHNGVGHLFLGRKSYYLLMSRGLLSVLGLGSVSEYLTKNANMPVVVVRPSSEDTAAKIKKVGYQQLRLGHDPRCVAPKRCGHAMLRALSAATEQIVQISTCDLLLAGRRLRMATSSTMSNAVHSLMIRLLKARLSFQLSPSTTFTLTLTGILHA